MVVTSWTRFPNLYATSVVGGHGRTRYQRSFARDIAEDAWHHAWSQLLRAYTGLDDVLFLTGNDVSLKHTPGTDVKSLESQTYPLYTGVFSTSAPLQLGLKLEIDHEARTAVLTSYGLVPSDHLPHIWAQLWDELSTSHEQETPEGIVTGTVLSISNPSPKLLPGRQLLHQLVHDPHDELVALEHLSHTGDRQRLSYRDLHLFSDSLATEIFDVLAQHHGRTTNIVPLLIPQGPELYIAELAILKAGAAFCPINVDAPTERIQFILADVSACIVLTTAALRSHLPSSEQVLILLVDEHMTGAARPSLGLNVHIEPNNPAYVMYTSGSTGTPKGVIINHLAVTQSLLAHEPAIPTFSRFLQFAAPTFDVSVFEIFFPLSRGCTLVSCDRMKLLDDLTFVISDMDVDAAELTPTVVADLLRNRSSVPSLRVLLTIGEMLTDRVVHEFGFDSNGHGCLQGMYGPTEASIHCTIEDSFARRTRPGIIGRPLVTVSAMIVAADIGKQGRQSFEVLPLGFLGELAIGGQQLAAGYLNRSEQTSEVFVDTEHHGRVYRTGDRARMLADGRIELFGRIESGQVKLRGQRIELGELEQTVLKLDLCRLAAASVNNGSLIVFCVASSDELVEEDVLSVCRSWLPSFMVPSVVKILSGFPYLPSGKVDKRKLIADYESLIMTLQDESDGTDQLEASGNALLKLVADVLPYRPTMHSDLAAAGLDSIRAIRCASHLRSNGWNVSMADLLRATNLAHLEASLRLKLNRSNGLVPPPQQASIDAQRDSLKAKLDHHLDIDEMEDIMQCTPVQAAMLIETMKDPKMYFNWFEFKVADSFGETMVLDSIKLLANRHAILRSSFFPLTGSGMSHATVVRKKLPHDSILVGQVAPAIKSKTQFDLQNPLRVRIHHDLNHWVIRFELHHALYDGWSVDLIREDLANILQSRRTDGQRQSFKAVAEYYAETRSASMLKATWEYWNDKLQDYKPNKLVNFNGRLLEHDGSGKQQLVLKVRTSEIRSKARNWKTSPQVLCQACVALLLSNYHDTMDVTYGTVTSGRDIAVRGVESVVGPCIVILPIRLNLGTCQTFLDAVNQVHSINLEALEHSGVPLKDLKTAGQVMPGQAMFDTLFVWQESMESSSADSIVSMGESWDELEFPLTLEFEPAHETLQISIRHQLSVISTSQATMILHQLDGMLQQLITSSSETISDIYASIEMRYLSVENPTPRRNRFEGGLAQHVERYAKECPLQSALEVFHSVRKGESQVERLSYDALNQRANVLAQSLRDAGIKSNDIICICMQKCIHLYVAILAIVKIGAGYLPITPETPTGRIETILSDASPVLCICSKASLDKVAESGISFLVVGEEEGWESICGNPELEYNGSDVAYVVYTSGSTGTPKGLIVTQDNLQSNLDELALIYPHAPGQKLLQSCSQAFDVSVFEIFFAWKTGMTLCTAINDVLFSDIELSIREMNITHLSLTPTVASLIDPVNVPGVQFLVTAGEAVTEQVFNRWAGRALFQGYGPAETVNICTVNSNVRKSDLINNIGPPFPNTSVLVLDPSSLVILPRGAVGELCFGGDQVCRGYLNRPRLTAEKFVEHPLYGRIYRSGDMGRLLPNGSILFESRADGQVKIRGQRVELGEINRTILGCDGVRDCTTIAIRYGSGAQSRLVVFWVPVTVSQRSFEVLSTQLGIGDITSRIYAELESRLAAYMIPANIVPVTILPQTPQGKINTTLLRTSFEQLSQAERLQTSSQINDRTTESGDWSEDERRLASCLAEVTGVDEDEASRHASFFSLGLDSISAIALSRMIGERFGRSLLVSEILKNASIARLAKVLLKAKSTPDAVPMTVTELLDPETHQMARRLLEDSGKGYTAVLPCTPLQAVMLAASIQHNTSTYTNRLTFKINVSLSSIRSAFDAVLRRHEMFRTVFLGLDSIAHPFVQVQLPIHHIKWQKIDSRKYLHHRGQVVEELTDLVKSNLNSLQPPFVLADVANEEDNSVLFICHHALYDALAMCKIMQEVESVLQRISLAQAPILQPFIAELLKAQTTDTYAWWRLRLEGFQPTPFPKLSYQAKDGKVLSHFDDQVAALRVLTPSLSKIQQSCQNFDCTMLVLLQTVWSRLLAAYLGHDQVCFGNVTSGRHLPCPGLESLVAPCFNTTPVVVDLTSCRSNINLIKQLQFFNTDALPHSMASWRAIQSDARIGSKSLFDTLVLLQHEPHRFDPAFWSLEEDVGDMNVPVILEFVPMSESDTLVLHLHIERALISFDDTQILLLQFEHLLAFIIDHPNASINDAVISRVSSTPYSDSCSVSQVLSSEGLPEAKDLIGRYIKLRHENEASDTVNEGEFTFGVRGGGQLYQVVPMFHVGELLITWKGVVKGNSQDRKGDLSRKIYETGLLARGMSDGIIQMLRYTQKHIDTISAEIRERCHLKDVLIVQEQDNDFGRIDFHAYAVSEPGLQGDIRDTVEEIRRALSQFSILVEPDQVHVLAAIPRTRFGGIDQVMLNNGGEATIDVGGSNATRHLWTSTMSLIRDAIQTVSIASQSQITPQTSIFRLGLDSISTIRVAKLIRKHYAFVTSGHVMQYPSCKALAEFLEGQKEKEVRTGQSFDFEDFETRIGALLRTDKNLFDHEIEAVLPCTPMQSGLLSEFLTSSGERYCNATSFRIKTTATIEKARESWALLVKHFQILRTGFAATGDRDFPFAMVVYPRHIQWTGFVKSDLIDIDPWLAATGHDIARSGHLPPWRLSIGQDSTGVRLMFAALHAIYDASSLDMIMRVFCDFLSSSKVEQELPIRPAISHILSLSRIKYDDEIMSFWQKETSKMHIVPFPDLNPLWPLETSIVTCSQFCSLTSQEIHGYCQQAEVTIQAAGQVAWGRLLAAYTGESIVTFGIVLANRNEQNLENVCFPCISTVPFGFEATFENGDDLKRAMKFNADVRGNELMPLAAIQRLAGRARESLFDTVFVYQNISPGKRKQWQVVEERAVTEYAVSIELEKTDGDRLCFRATFDTAKLPEAQAQLMLRQLDAIFSHLLTEPHGTFDQLSRHKNNLFAMNAPDIDALPSTVNLLHEFVEEKAIHTPNAVAFEFVRAIQEYSLDSTTWTYQELNDQGNRVANLLSAHGARPGDLVGICFEKCAEASFAILGILKAGCAYVALDPNAPVERKSFILEDSKAQVVLCGSDQMRGLQGSYPGTIVDVDQALKESTLSSTQSRLQTAPSETCYVLYTSGTTGTPKGCEISHESAVQAMLSFQKLFHGHWDKTSRWLQFASFHFDVSVLEQYWSWSVGICVVSAPRDLIFEDLARSIRLLRITHIDLTPSLAKLLHPDEVPDLCRGVFITGGEKLQQEILDVWGPKGVVYNGYGPTEATIGVTMYPRVPTNGKPSNIGPAFANVGTCVLRPNTELPAFRGAVGELCVSGKLVGKGYLNRADLTAERFPTLKDIGLRVYRTGDLVRQLHDGSFEFLGRADDQVKLRGQRLEMGEINSVIKRSSEAFADVATLIVKASKQQRDLLVTFASSSESSKQSSRTEVLLTGTLAQSCREARTACIAKLPPYMLPTYIIPITRMPLSINNKTDQQQLKVLFESIEMKDLVELSAAGSDDESRPLNEDERRIVAILQDFASFDAAEVSSTSNIFQLGLDSIVVFGFSQALRANGFSSAAVSVIMNSKLNNSVFVMFFIWLTDLTYATIAELSNALHNDSSSRQISRFQISSAKRLIASTARRSRRVVLRTLNIAADDVEMILPCTPLQQGMISRSISTGGKLYFNSFELLLSESISVQRLKEAWQTALDSLMVLRAQFVPTNSGHVQVIRRHLNLVWEEMHPSTTQEGNAIVQERHERWCERNRELLSSPLEFLLLISGHERRLIVRIFHALYDANSLTLLFDFVAASYNNTKAEAGPSFSKALLYGPLMRTRESKEFWKHHLCASPRLRRQDNAEVQVGTSHTSIVLTMGKKLTSLRRELAVTDQAVVQACWVATLLKYFEYNMILGLVVCGRSIDFRDADKVVAPMFNTIPFHIGLSEQDTWASLIQECHDFNVEAVEHTHTSLREIRKWLELPANKDLFNTLFVFQKEIVAKKTLNLWKLVEAPPQADYPLAFNAVLSASGQLSVSLIAQSTFADEKTLQELLEVFEKSLLASFEDCDGLVLDTIGTIQEVSQKDTPAKEYSRSKKAPSVAIVAWTPAQALVRDVVGTLSGADASTIKPDTSILELGLDSIDAIKLSSKLKHLGHKVAVGVIMRERTIDAISRQLESCASEEEQSDAETCHEDYEHLSTYLRREGVMTDAVEDVLPATAMQEAMCAEMLSSNFERYYNSSVYRVSTRVDLERLSRAWQQVIQASPILRTAFIPIDDVAIDCTFAQVIHKQAPKMEITRNAASAEAAVEHFEEYKTARLGSPLRPLLVQALYTLGDKVLLMLSLPHAMYDGWSLELVHADVQRAYAGLDVRRPPNDRIISDIRQASTSDEAATFWRETLEGILPSQLPLKSPLDQSSSTIWRLERASRASYATIRAFAKKHGISMQTLCMTCWAIVLASRLRKFEVVFGVVLSGRETPEAQEANFPTMNTVAVPVSLYGTVLDVLRDLQDYFGEAREYLQFPLARATRFAQTNGTLLFNTLFVHQARPKVDHGPRALLYEAINGNAEVEFPACIESEIVEEALIWRMACRDEFMDQSNTEGLVQSLETVLENVLRSPEESMVEENGHISTLLGLEPFEASENSDDEVIGKNGASRPEVNGAWSEMGLRIRAVLAQSAGFSEDEIPLQATMYHLGHDSISAIKLSRLFAKQGIKLSVGDLIRGGSIADVIRIAESRSDDTEGRLSDDRSQTNDPLLSDEDVAEILAANHLDGAEVEYVLPASAGQIYMLSLWQKSRGKLFYASFKYRLSKMIPLQDLERSWVELVQQNPILRTTLVPIGRSDIPTVQIALKGSASQMTAPKTNEQHFRSAFEASMVSLDVRSEDESWQLELRLPHTLYDGVSLAILLKQLEAGCNHKMPSIDTGGLLRRLIAAQYTTTASRRRQQFWQSYLAGKSATTVSQPKTLRDRVEVFEPKALGNIDTMITKARLAGVTLQAYFVAAYAKVLHQLTPRPKNADAIIGLYLAKRSSHLEGLEDAAVPTFNLIPIRVRLSASGDVHKLARMVQDDMKDVANVDNAGVGLWEIYKWTGVRVDTFVNFLKLPGVTGEDEAVDEQKAAGTAVLTEAGERRHERYARIAELGNESWDESKMFMQSQLEEAYLFSIDIEVAVLDGQLAMGVFAPTEMLELNGARKLITDVTKTLEGI